jgi:signal transduction histidine kinase
VPAAGGLVKAELFADPERKGVEIAITDNGCGIPEQIFNRIFNPFFSTKKSKKNVGLGLSVCQRIVEMHNGMISCKSEPGRSTRFSVLLPRADAEGVGGLP